MQAQQTDRPQPPRPARVEDASPDPWPDWRKDLFSTSGMYALAGVWLILAPFALTYTSRDPYWNDVAVGTMIAAIGLVRLGGGARASILSRITAVIALWIFVSAFWLDESDRAAINDMVLGIVVLALSLASVAATDRSAEL